MLPWSLVLCCRTEARQKFMQQPQRGLANELLHAFLLLEARRMTILWNLCCALVLLLARQPIPFPAAG